MFKLEHTGTQKGLSYSSKITKLVRVKARIESEYLEIHVLFCSFHDFGKTTTLMHLNLLISKMEQ